MIIAFKVRLFKKLRKKNTMLVMNIINYIVLLITFNVKRERRDRDIRKYHFASNEEEAPYEM